MGRLTAAVATVVLGVGLCASPSSLATGAPVPAPRAGERPNVVVVLTDDMRRDDLRYLPNVRRLLVDKGRSYSRAIAPHPLCCPTRAELVTGQYGQNNGVHHNVGPWGGFAALQDNDNTIAAWLSRAGYRTSYTGKYLNGYEWEHGVTRASTPRPPGWTVWDPVMTDIYAYWKSGYWNGDTYDGRYVADVITERTNRTIRRFSASGDPFFLLVNQLAPHSTGPEYGNRDPRYKAKYADLLRGVKPPLRSDPAFNEADVSDLPGSMQRTLLTPAAVTKRAETWRARIRALRSVDDSVAKIVAQLRESGELANTYFVFTSDNGFHLGEHRLIGKNSVYRESLDIPLVVRGPGVEAGSSSGARVTLVDLPATVLRWTGARPGRPQDGLPFAALEQGGVRDTVLIQTGDESADATPGWWFRGVLAGRYTYAQVAGNPREGVLFDHARDPHELVNLFHDPRYAAIRTELAHRTRVLERCSGASCNQTFGPLPAPLL